MKPAGYMAKRIAGRPAWLDKAKQVVDVYSVSHCISPDFADYINFWKHNQFWFFDSIEIIKDLCKAQQIPLEGCTYLYYEFYSEEFLPDVKAWRPFEGESTFSYAVDPPSDAKIMGYDVVSYFAGTSHECSPLSCNGLAAEITTNSHCLIDTFEATKRLLETGAFDNSEPGPLRIVSVSEVKPA